MLSPIPPSNPGYDNHGMNLSFCRGCALSYRHQMFSQSLDKHAALDQTKTRPGVWLDNEDVVVCGGFFRSLIKWAHPFFL